MFFRRWGEGSSAPQIPYLDLKSNFQAGKRKESEGMKEKSMHERDGKYGRKHHPYLRNFMVTAVLSLAL